MTSDPILTSSKIYFEPLNPDPDKICIRDIAHALSLMTRANGHFREFYSVAQHSIACYYEAKAKGYEKRLRLACLLHDSSEAYIADITRPVKHYLKEYLTIEQNLQDCIYKKFLGSIPDETERIKISTIDDSLLYHEFFHYTGVELFEYKEIITKGNFEIRPFLEIEEEFITCFESENTGTN